MADNQSAINAQRKNLLGTNNQGLATDHWYVPDAKKPLGAAAYKSAYDEYLSQHDDTGGQAPLTFDQWRSFVDATRKNQLYTPPANAE